MGDSKMASSPCVDGLQKYRKWREDEAFCDHEKKDVESQMKKRLGEGKTGFECLPYEILLDILSRLLLMSILRARYTCKGWHRIMADPEFIEMHLNRASRIFGYLYRFSGDFAIYYVQKTVYGIEAIKTCDASFGHNYFFSGHTSSGGLMACYSYKESSYYICNPFIGERVKVRRGCIYECNLSWGFGYSPSTKEYKLVTFGTKRVDNETVIKGEIYTLGSESWRQIPHVSLPPTDKQVDCDGTLFWMIHTRFYQGGPETVMSFDVGTEKFRAWRAPPLEVIMHLPELKLAYLVKFDDTVAYVVTTQPFCFNIWILRDKVNDIWINEYKIVVPHSPLRSLRLNLVGKWMNRLLFAGVDHKRTPKCASYDVDKEEFTIIQMPFWDYHDKCRDIHFERIASVSFISHAPSFVSPLKIMSISRANGQCK